MGERKRRAGGSEHRSQPGDSCTDPGSDRAEHTLLKGQAHRHWGIPDRKQCPRDGNIHLSWRKGILHSSATQGCSCHEGTVTGQLGPCCHHPSVSQADPVCTTRVGTKPQSTMSCEMPWATPWPWLGVPGVSSHPLGHQQEHTHSIRG